MIDSARGWSMVAATFTLLFLAFGAAYAFTAFFPSLEAEFNASRQDVALIFGISGFLYFMLGALSGAIADWIGTRPVVLFGVLLCGGGIVWGSFAQSLMEAYLAFGLGIGVGIGFFYVPAIGAVQRWFTVRRAMAAGFAAAGIGAGTMIMPGVAKILIAEPGGWRYAYGTIGICVLLLGFVAALRIDDPPSHSTARRAGTGLQGARVKQALVSRGFVLLYLSSLMLSLGLFVPFVHLEPYAQDKGLGEGTGVFLLMLIGVGSTLGRFVLASLADKIGRRNALALMYAGVGLMDLVWYWGGSLHVLYVFAVVYGLCYGGFVGTAPAVSADYFGVRKLSSIIGWLYTSVAFGTLAGPPLAGRAFDLYQSYDLPILIGAVSGLIAAVLVLLMGPPRRWD
jgi:MFS family permease